MKIDNIPVKLCKQKAKYSLMKETIIENGLRTHLIKRVVVERLPISDSNGVEAKLIGVMKDKKRYFGSSIFEIYLNHRRHYQKHLFRIPLAIVCCLFEL